MEGAVEGMYAQSAGAPKSRILEVPDTTSGIDAFIMKKADALALTSMSIQHLINISGERS
jgi:hypothetical protein